MRAKHPEMASDQAKMGLKWGVLASESTRIIEKRALASAAKLRPLGISAACYASSDKDLRPPLAQRK